MSDINTVTLTGRLGGKPDLRYTPKGTAVAQVSLAVSGWDGEQETTDWIGLTFWGKLAEAAQKNLDKGRKIAVSGRLRQEEWTDQETQKKQRKTRVVVERWTYADSPKREGGGGQGEGERGRGGDETAAAGAQGGTGEDDIPF
jgi:single-strand DNA-binding protein